MLKKCLISKHFLQSDLVELEYSAWYSVIYNRINRFAQ